MRTVIQRGILVNEGRAFGGALVIEDGHIAEVIEGGEAPRGSYDECVDATGCFVLPGIIDTHVHFREPGLMAKADIESESRAAAYGGVTSYLDMPNTVPQTTTLEALDEKYRLAKGESHVNYGFFFGATNDNADLFGLLDTHRIPGIKLFMGSSTGNMLVDREASLRRIFATSPLPIMAHCEDTSLIQRNMEACRQRYGDDPPIGQHPHIRSAEACYASTRQAVELAREYHAQLHVAHVSTARELELFGDDGRVTAEAVVAHLYFTDADYGRLGARIKCNPAIKAAADRDALRRALADGRIATVATDHAPHRWEEKQGGAAKALSGMPMIQFSLPTMLELVDEGILTIERMVDLMCHAPARLFQVRQRGFLRPGYRADVAVVRPHAPWKVTKDVIQSKCGWSPMEGHEYQWQVARTICNGRTIYCDGTFAADSRGEELRFR